MNHVTTKNARHRVGWWVLPPALLALALAAPSAQADANLAAQNGCINCHGSAPRGESPSFERMRARAASQSERQPAELAAHWLEEMRATSHGPRAIVAHRQVSEATARALVEWLSTPPAQPVR